MLKGFRDFIMRGNIVELAIAVVIGTAFTAIVAAFTSAIIQPIINSIGGQGAADGLGFRILSDNPDTFVNIGAVINAIITFLITAAVVYFIFVVPMNKINARFKKGKEETLAAAPTDVELLIEIRDLLKAQHDGPLPTTVKDSPTDTV
ncbi:large conductance mechanosensitive channel protein MscL [Nakamurella sp. YIM 132087]|uniref:Large-conductance mechanosensitive channel n=1 Tax=Nakamurella alba TaxID=2665158 RepID=A0A7K1FI72_9ACTN|nr:large conductance mechanosensitive channel protein MscL [Nakamurella alba]